MSNCRDEDYSNGKYAELRTALINIWLLVFIRFDNGTTRTERQLTNNISDIWLILNSNLKDSCVEVRVLQWMSKYRSRTSFTQYIPSKLAKYGIKVWWVTNSRTSYPLYGQIYTGMGSTGEREKNQGERVVKDLNIMLKSTWDSIFKIFQLSETLINEN